MSDFNPETVPPPPEPAPPPEKLTLIKRIEGYRHEHETAEMCIFFVLGFAFDVATMDRIDNAQTLIQQAVYLAVLGGLLILDQKYALPGVTPPGFLQKAWGYREAAIHFFFGSLLSSFALFYFKSASGLTAVGFPAILFGLLVANELPQFRHLGPVVRMGLFSFSVTSYLAYVLPIVAGFISDWIFLGSATLCMLLLVGLFQLLKKWGHGSVDVLKRVVAPWTAMQVLLLTLYFLRAIPPVPLSVQYMGIFHAVEKDAGNFKLLHSPLGWKFWHHGDQEFYARAGDKVNVFSRIFAPRAFRDKVYLRWSHLDAKSHWVTSDRIALTVVGGRDEGFRGHAYKANYEPGSWRVTAETEDGREIGSIDFTIIADPTTDIREMEVTKG